ncbi:serine hydrolase [Candidatus Cryosericum septentrionale]|jgi:beta-lactamase class A|uniref:beta-lactamase n=1 Tax=Candidatus Cryosericum septentrionale TaxID=2290913 RepID=A0A398DYY4_9BACT|nr:serine hydrolase [Candidatus Cryosericum septentrionale]RIE15601.1 serine hydrolase [Candidatus Cryosericum septentrionale]
MKQDTRYLPVQKALQGILATIAFPCAVHAELLSAEDRCLIFSQNSNLPFGAASIIKLPLLVCVAQLVELGELAWDRPIRLTVPAPHGTGLLEHLDKSGPWSVQDLCIMMMGVSDNMACNQLIEEIGIERLNDVLQDLGYQATSIRRQMMDHETLARGIDNSVTAAEIADMLARLHAHRLVSNEASQRILDYLRMNQLKDLIAWPLPGSAALAGKTGGMPGSLLDAELVSVADGPTYSLCVFASGFDRAVQAKRLMVQVSERVYEAVSGSCSADCV